MPDFIDNNSRLVISQVGNMPTATAKQNPGKVLDVDCKSLPALVDSNDRFLLVTVLKAGQAGDVACYQALVKSNDFSHARRFVIGEKVAKDGDKITGKEAGKIFDGIDRAGWYRV